MKNSRMKRQGLNRRQFIRNSTLLAGTALLSSWALPGVCGAAAQTGKRTAVDQVMLGKLQPIVDALIAHYQAEQLKADATQAA